MTGQRVAAWLLALALAALLYIVSVIVTQQWTQNGAWLLLVIVFIAAAVDACRQAAKDRGRG